VEPRASGRLAAGGLRPRHPARQGARRQAFCCFALLMKPRCARFRWREVPPRVISLAGSTRRGHRRCTTHSGWNPQDRAREVEPRASRRLAAGGLRPRHPARQGARRQAFCCFALLMKPRWREVPLARGSAGARFHLASSLWRVPPAVATGAAPHTAGGTRRIGHARWNLARAGSWPPGAYVLVIQRGKERAAKPFVVLRY
jgi:hypothetical protein